MSLRTGLRSLKERVHYFLGNNNLLESKAEEMFKREREQKDREIEEMKKIMEETNARLRILEELERKRLVKEPVRTARTARITVEQAQLATSIAEQDTEQLIINP